MKMIQYIYGKDQTPEPRHEAVAEMVWVGDLKWMEGKGSVGSLPKPATSRCPSKDGALSRSRGPARCPTVRAERAMRA